MASIFDKALRADLLLSPMRLEVKTDFPAMWPAWNMDWADQSRTPRVFVGTRGGKTQDQNRGKWPSPSGTGGDTKRGRSTFVQTIRLSAGDAGNRIEFANAIDWDTRASHLKAVFPLTASNPKATYNWDIGTIERGTDSPAQFEVASHQWVDLTDQSGKFGATLLTDCKNGSDKPDGNTLRLTLIRTPGTRLSIPGIDNTHAEQGTQDVGHHEFVYGLAGHAGDWRQSQTDWQAYRLNQPMAAFVTARHAGPLGRTFSFLTVSNTRLRVLALKKAENTDEMVLRLVEMDGKPVPSAEIAFAGAIAAAREVNGAEELVGPAVVKAGKLITSFAPFQPRTFAVRLAPAIRRSTPIRSEALPLPFDVAVSSAGNSAYSGPGIDGRGNTIPSEMLPEALSYNGVTFRVAAGSGVKNALIPRGQRIDLPAGHFNSLYVMAVADGDQRTSFQVGDRTADLTIQNWTGFIGQWDNRIWKGAEQPIPARAGQPAGNRGTRLNPFAEMVGLRPGFIKRTPVALYCSHYHTADGKNQPYAYSYIFCYRMEVPETARSLILPTNEKIRILAVSVSEEGAAAVPAAPLYDTLEHSR